jgi:phage terminase large subunit-like protein
LTRVNGAPVKPNVTPLQLAGCAVPSGVGTTGTIIVSNAAIKAAANTPASVAGLSPGAAINAATWKAVQAAQVSAAATAGRPRNACQMFAIATGGFFNPCVFAKTRLPSFGR